VQLFLGPQTRRLIRLTLLLVVSHGPSLPPSSLLSLRTCPECVFVFCFVVSVRAPMQNPQRAPLLFALSLHSQRVLSLCALPACSECVLASQAFSARSHLRPHCELPLFAPSVHSNDRFPKDTLDVNTCSQRVVSVRAPTHASGNRNAPKGTHETDLLWLEESVVKERPTIHRIGIVPTVSNNLSLTLPPTAALHLFRFGSSRVHACGVSRGQHVLCLYYSYYHYHHYYY